MYTHKLKIRTTAAFLTLGAAVLMAGCSTPTTSVSQSATVAPTDPATPVVTPAPVETTPAVAPIVAGAVLTDAQVAALPDGVKAYALSDGTKVAVVKGEPLPEAVVADAAAPTVAEIAAIGNDSTADYTALLAAINSSVSRIIGQTGRNAVVIYRVVDIDQVTRWQASGAAVMKPAPASKAAILAHVQAYIAAQKDPSSWEIIDASN